MITIFFVKYTGLLLILLTLFITIIIQIFASNTSIDICDDVPPSYINCTTKYAQCLLYIHEDYISNYHACCYNYDCLCNSSHDLYNIVNFICGTDESSNESWNNMSTLGILGVTIILTVTFSIFYIRRYFLRKMGLAKHEIEAIDTYTRGFRNKFPVDKIAFQQAKEKLILCEYYSTDDNKILIRSIDFLGRKSLHYFSLMILTYAQVIFLKKEFAPSLNGIIIFSVIELCLAGCFWNIIHVPRNFMRIIAPIIYGGHNRIQDGPSANWNLTIALTIGSLRTIITGLILFNILKQTMFDFSIRHNYNYQEIRRHYLLCWVISNNGVTFGDTAGEGIGAFLGKHRFKVKGIAGQENERSIEGSAGVLFFSLLSNALSVAFLSDFLHIYTAKILIFLVVLSLGITILEAYSFKGTDNIIISVYSQLIVYILLIKL